MDDEDILLNMSHPLACLIQIRQKLGSLSDGDLIQFLQFLIEENHQSVIVGGIFQQLYNTETDLLIGFINTNLINYIALISVIFLIITHVKFDYLLTRGFILFIILLLITYLLPEKMIMELQKYMYIQIVGKSDKDSFLYKHVSEVCILFGFCISLIFIFITYWIFKYLKDNYLIHRFIIFYKNIFK